MTEIIFYTGVSDELPFLVKLSEKTIKMRRKACIATRDIAHSKAVSKYLWTHDPTKFIPHSVDPEDLNDQLTALELRYDDTSSHLDILINLTEKKLSQFSSFHRLVEIITKNKGSIDMGRQRFKWYRDRGYDIKVHKM